MDVFLDAGEHRPRKQNVALDRASAFDSYCMLTIPMCSDDVNPSYQDCILVFLTSCSPRSRPKLSTTQDTAKSAGRAHSAGAAGPGPHSRSLLHLARRLRRLPAVRGAAAVRGRARGVAAVALPALWAAERARAGGRGARARRPGRQQDLQPAPGLARPGQLAAAALAGHALPAHPRPLRGPGEGAAYNSEVNSMRRLLLVTLTFLIPRFGVEYRARACNCCTSASIQRAPTRRPGRACLSTDHSHRADQEVLCGLSQGFRVCVWFSGCCFSQLVCQTRGAFFSVVGHTSSL